MTLRNWFAIAASAALIAGTGACKNSGSDSSTSSSQGRRGETLPRARGADAGSDMTTRPGGVSGSAGSTQGTTGGSSASGGMGSASGADTSTSSKSGSSGNTGTTGNSGSSNSGSNSGGSNR